MAGLGGAVKAGPGLARQGMVRRGVAVGVRLGAAGHGKAR